MSLYFSDYKRRFSGEIFFYGNASHALYDMLVWLQDNRPKARPNIVLPIFIPAKLYRIVLAAGYEPKFYDISLNCRMNVNRVKDLIDEQTQAVFCIHYFGIPASLKELKSHTAANDIFLIEDCAHILNSNWQGEELGNIGDCAIFSSRKMLQLPAGGFLVLNKRLWSFKPGYSKRVRSIFTAYKLVQTRAKYVYYYLTRGGDPLDLAWIPRIGYINFAEKQKIQLKKSSWLNQAYVHFVDLDKVAHIRRANYEYLFNEIKDFPFIKPLAVSEGDSGMIRRIGDGYCLREGVTPYSLPVLVPVGTRSMLLKILREKGIGCGAGWPESPFGYNGFNHTLELSERLLEFPIHQGVNRYQLDRIIDCLHTCQKAEFVITNEKKSKKTEVV